jgi:hypothetical protein
VGSPKKQFPKLAWAFNQPERRAAQRAGVEAMFLTRKHLSRRTLLKGAGVSLALPFLDAMLPAMATSAQTAAARTLRAGFFYIPHGAVMYNTKYGAQMDRWTPSGEGSEFTLNKITGPLDPYKKYVTSFGNLKNDAATGIHTKNPGTWLSGEANLGKTVDQIIADHIAKGSQIPSLQLASETTVQQGAGNGVGSASTLSFRDGSTPMPIEFNPRVLFLRLFGDEKGRVNTKQDAAEEASLLDLIAEQTRALQRDLNPSDRAVLDGHLTAVREAEQRVAKRAEGYRNGMEIPERPPGVLEDFGEQVKLLFDLIAIAYWSDLTRVVSLMMAAESTNRRYPHIGIPDSFHELSHYGDDTDKLEKLVRIQTWHMQCFADFLGKLAAVQDVDGTLLDNAMFLYGSNMSNSDQHSTRPLPTLLVGGGAGKLTGARHLEPLEFTPIANLHLALLEKVGIEQKAIGDSTGVLSL